MIRLFAALLVGLCGAKLWADPLAALGAGEGVFYGAYMDFGETEDTVTLEGIEKFEKLGGKRPAIIASSSYWGQQTFPSKNLALIARHGAVPLVFWSPWDKPYTEQKGPDRFALTEILAGKWDAYIDSWGDSAKAFGKPFFVSFCNEMNGDWFPWSGCFYGGENGGPDVFKKTWRYVVDRVRARGASNISWVLHLNAFPGENDVWNMMASYYPGDDYVDWLGLSIYGKQFYGEGNWAYFRDLIAWPYEEVTEIAPDKPVMVAEFGCGDFPKSGSKAQWLRDALTMIPTFPRIKAAVYWHERWQNEDGTFSNLRINSSPATLAAFRQGIADSRWLGAEARPTPPQ
jgi:hypothetical protein